MSGMLPLSEIHRVALTVDAARRSSVADEVLAAWGFGPGAARHVRSSASHVFAVFRGQATAACGYLRFVPAAHRDRARVEAVAALMHRLHGSGLPVAGPCGPRPATWSRPSPRR